MWGGEHWLYGDLRHYAKNPHTEKWTIYETATGIETDVDETTIGQFTELHDKNGQEIYEGDIVVMTRTPEKRQICLPVRHIVISDSVCSWTLESLAKKEVCSYMMAGFSDFHSYKFEVIGNIHDNPELAQPYSLNLPEPKRRKPKRKDEIQVEFVVKDDPKQEPYVEESGKIVFEVSQQEMNDNIERIMKEKL